MWRRRVLIGATVAALLVNDLPLRMLSAGDWPWKGRKGPETAVTQLAAQIDELERHIDTYGTIVAKAPDVWGQARLTKFRRDYETQMQKQLDQFKIKLNGAISRSDQAYLANAVAMQAAVSGPSAFTRVPNSGAQSSDTTEATTEQRIEVPESVDASGLVGDPNAEKSDIITRTKVRSIRTIDIGLEPTVELDQLSRYLNHLNELRRISDGDDSADAPGYAMHLVRIPISVLPGKETRQGYGAEVTVIARPNIHDDLLPETFRQLVINDLVDQLAFPLAKFLDSKESSKILDQLDEALKKQTPQFEAGLCRLQSGINEINAVLAQFHAKQPTPDDLATLRTRLDDLLEDAVKSKILDPEKPKTLLAGVPTYDEIHIFEAPNAKEYFARGQNYIASNKDVTVFKSSTKEPTPNELDEIKWKTSKEVAQLIIAAQSKVEDAIRDIEKEISDVTSQIDEIKKKAGLAEPQVPATPSRRAQLPFPSSHLLEVDGTLQFLVIAKIASALKKDETSTTAALLLDMQRFLAEELNAAYDFLNKNPTLWGQCHPAISDAVRGDNEHNISELRRSFLCSVSPPELHNSHTAAMAWMILVEAALLDERLKQDIHDLSLAKNLISVSEEELQCLRFCDPNPSPEARAMFNEYVTTRWPIHVVAVDPITQDQNIADTFSQRREMQLALAIALTSGQIGANSFTRMARRLELDMETIALNRTVVGFSHGEDTFGWRFYPRFQSPDTGGHFQTYAVDMFKGLSRDTYIKASRLEPGIREVTAIVIMPSFVPYVTFDVRANWFKLTKPSKKVLTMQDSMDLSADIMRLRQLSATCVRDAHLYRADDLGRLDRSVQALERRLPLQTSVVPMPFENTLGGFEFFNTGVGDLAPELKGFYGEPGIKVKAAAAASTADAAAAAPPAGISISTPVSVTVNGTPAAADKASDSKSGTPAAKTSIFLVGDHFSVHETEVIAGNRSIPKEDFVLLSRQVMRVNIPETVLTVKSGDHKFVDVHIATPYGISNHLLVPIVEDEKKPESDGDNAAIVPFAFKLAAKDLTACLCFGCPGDGTTLHCLKPIEINVTAKCPCACPADFGYAAFVVVKNAKGDPIPMDPKPTTGCIGIKPPDCDLQALCQGGKATLKLDTSDSSELVKGINLVLRDICKTDSPATIELDGCIRIHNCGCPHTAAAACQYDYLKLPTITIKLSECPSATPGCSPAPAPATEVPPPPGPGAGLLAPPAGLRVTSPFDALQPIR